MAGGIAAPVDYSPDHRLHHNQLPETRLRKAPSPREKQHLTESSESQEPTKKFSKSSQLSKKLC